MIRRLHLLAALLAVTMIATFWISTVLSELFGSSALVVSVKTAIPWGLCVLIPALGTAGATGMALAKRHPGPLVARKKRRMPVIAAVGLIVLVPSALFLGWKAGRHEFDTAFYIVQTIELCAGGLNLALLSLNVRDGLQLAGRIRTRRTTTQSIARDGL